MNASEKQIDSPGIRGNAHSPGNGRVAFAAPAYFAHSGQAPAQLEEEEVQAEETGLITDEEVLDSDDPSTADADGGGEQEDAGLGLLTEEDETAYYTAAEEPIELLGQTHHIALRKKDGEWTPGISSDFIDIHDIYVAFRGENLLDDNLRSLHERARKKSRDHILSAGRARDIYQRIDALEYYPGLPRRKKLISSITATKIRQLRGQHREQAQDRDLKLQQLNALIRYFISAAAQINSTIVAEILGASMPPIVLATDVTNTSAANTYRYHTGAVGDPIPLTWYKPVGSYNDIIVDDYTSNNPPDQVTLQPGVANPAVTAANGATYNFGVTAANFAAGQTWKNVAKHGSDRAVQKRLNQVLASLNYDLGAQNEDGDHVRDLGFGGADHISNYWPLDSTTNRLAFTGWRSRYYLNYKTGQRANGNWELEKAPLNSGSLVGKFFTITAEAAQAVPQNDENSGSDTNWGTAGTILADDGTPIAEG